jgi:ATP-dependent helicase/DNAse subunit B
VESLVIEGIQDIGIWKTDSSKEDLDKIMKRIQPKRKPMLRYSW